MANELIPCHDPFSSDAVTEYHHIQSVYYSGSYPNVTAPAAANFPVQTPTRYFLPLPFVIDATALTGARPVLLRDVDNTTDLTRVTGAPGANQFRVAPSDSAYNTIIELHSGQAGVEIGYDLYATEGATTGNASDEIVMQKSIDIWGDLTSSGDSSITGSITVSGGIDNSGGTTLKTKIIEIGDWDMDTTLSSGAIAHGLGSSWTNIRHLSAVIRQDSDGYRYPLLSSSAAATGGQNTIEVRDDTNVYLTRETGGFFDSANFNSTSYNRGWIYIIYEV
jgi:hypothetical protein